MFLKSLKISTGNTTIRDIKFRKGMNLIVDETIALNEKKTTGNNVGKTTVLKLIDFCLGGKSSNIYSDTDSNHETYNIVKDFLIDNEILITLVLKSNLEEINSQEIKIERNFLVRKNCIRRINGDNYTEAEFEEKLLRLIFPNQLSEKPTFRQIISHNIRYKDLNINNTLKTLDRFTSDVEYETLHLFLLNCNFDKGDKRQRIFEKLLQERNFKVRLEKKQTKSAYETTLSIIEDEIQELNIRKKKLNINDNFEEDLEELNNVKYQINKISSKISNLKIRRDLIIEAQKELEQNSAIIDYQQLKLIYQQTIDNISNIQRTFEELVQYHNSMIIEKIKFITKDLPYLENEVSIDNQKLKTLLSKEKLLTNKISKTKPFQEMESLIIELNEKFQKKGEYENIVSQLNEVDNNIKQYIIELKEIDSFLFSDKFGQLLRHQINKFNKFFSSISNNLYGERYALNYDKKLNKNNQSIYKFTSFNANFSSGKKQGEILCFDIAYILFADDEEIPCLHFLLNDKKELMHDNQIIKVTEFIENQNIQLVISMLKDKLPDELKNDLYCILKLSQNDKLFRIEK